MNSRDNLEHDDRFSTVKKPHNFRDTIPIHLKGICAVNLSFIKGAGGLHSLLAGKNL